MTAKLHPRPPIDRALILKTAALSGVLGSGGIGAPRILAALCNPEISANQVAALVGNDPALSLRVLRVANSAYYKQSRAITNIERALGLLGRDCTRGIAAAACLDRVMRGNTTALVDMQALMHHSQATAAAAEALASIRHPALASEAFIGGLLHNLGTAVQAHLDPRGVKAMIESLSVDEMLDIGLLEARHAAVGHAECGAVIFEAWDLPESLIAATRHHHEPTAGADRHRELTALIALGASLARGAGFTFTLEPIPLASARSSMIELGLNDDELDAIAASLPERVAALTQALLAA
jgi:HD-like signal output (HDOD) protein